MKNETKAPTAIGTGTGEITAVFVTYAFVQVTSAKGDERITQRVGQLWKAGSLFIYKNIWNSPAWNSPDFKKGTKVTFEVFEGKQDIEGFNLKVEAIAQTKTVPQPAAATLTPSAPPLAPFRLKPAPQRPAGPPEILRAASDEPAAKVVTQSDSSSSEQQTSSTGLGRLIGRWRRPGQVASGAK